MSNPTQQIKFGCLFLLLVGCSSSKDDLFNEEIQRIDLKANTVKMDSFVFSSPYAMTVLDSVLIIEDLNYIDNFVVVNVKNGSVRKAGHVGEGPGEITWPTSIQKVPAGTGVGMYLRAKFDFCETGADSFLLPPAGKKRTGFSTNYQKIVKVNDSTYVGPGLFRKRYAISNIARQVVNEAGEFPRNGETMNVSSELMAMAYQVDIDVSPKGNRFVVGSKRSANLEIYDVNGFNLSPVKIFTESHPSFYSSGGENMIKVVFNRESRDGFLDITVDDENIFALYSGKLYGDQIDSGNRIYVFDWDGNLKSRLDLDREVSCIGIDKSTETLYGIEYGENGKVVGYSVSTLY